MPAEPLTQGKSLQAQIDALGVRMDAGFAKLEKLLQSFDDRIRKIETIEAGCQPLLHARLEEAWKEIDEHADNIKSLTDLANSINLAIGDLKRTQAILTWFGGIMGSAIIIGLISYGLIRILK